MTSDFLEDLRTEQDQFRVAQANRRRGKARTGEPNATGENQETPSATADHQVSVVEKRKEEKEEKEEKEQLPPLPPASGGEAPKVSSTGRKPRKASLDAFMESDIPREIIDAALRLYAAWDKNDPDGREIHSAFPLMVTRMADIIEKHKPVLTIEILEQGAMDYLAQKMQRRKAPQYYFSYEPATGQLKAIWRSYAEAAYMKQKIAESNSVPPIPAPLLLEEPLHGSEAAGP
jgi:hypothetical protein